MTREEATAYWKQRSEHIHNWLEENEDADFIGEYVEAIDMAIKALQAECEDYEHATLVDIKEPLKVLVVRCKDCKWAEKAIFDEYCVECTMHHTTFMKHGFCNHGERRESTE